MQTELSPNPQTNQMASQGRKGDTMMAHVTPGDYVIPKDIVIAHPEFLTKLKKVMEDEGEDYRTHMVGSGFENMNPETGAPEFGFFGGIKKAFQGVGNIVGGTASKLLPESVSQPFGNLVGQAAPVFGPLGGSYAKGYSQGMTIGKNGPAGSASTPTPYTPSTMQLPSSLQELGGLTDQQRRSYLATQGLEGSGLGGSAKEYYANLLQRNIQADQGSLLPVESQYLQMQGVNPSLSGQALVDALRGF